MFELVSSKIAMELSTEEKTRGHDHHAAKARIEQLNIFSYHVSDSNTKRPKELRALAFKQNVEV